MNTKVIPYAKQYISEEDKKMVLDVLDSDLITQGPIASKLEVEFAQRFNSNYASVMANGTAALHLCAIAIGIKPGDKVITTPITFVASANGFRYEGAEICFCDIDPRTYLMDLNKLEQILDKSPIGTYKAVIPVDFAGYPIDSKRLKSLADKYKFYIIEDACHAPGAYYYDSDSSKISCGSGAYSDLTVFSFHPAKHIAAGEGGAITSNNKDLIDRINLFKNHGILKHPNTDDKSQGIWFQEMHELGYNYRITDFQSALALSQLRRLDWSLSRRNEIASLYNESFKNHDKISTPYVDSSVFHAYHLYVIQVEERKSLYNYLRTKGIYCQIHYVPTHLMPYYKQFGWKEGDLPVAERYYDKCISLPMYPTLTIDEQLYVIESILNFFSK